MKKLLILSGKGGTGKTTTAAAFIRFSQARAFADCDVDAPNLHIVADTRGECVHSDYFGSEKAVIDSEKCRGCGACASHCRFDAISKADGRFKVNEFACEGCGVCLEVCPAGAVAMLPDAAGRLSLYRDSRVFSTAELKMGRGNSGKLVSEVKSALFHNAPETDLAIIDGAPGIGCPVIASMTGVDLVLIVTEPTLSGLSDLERLLKTAGTFRTRASVSVNKYDVCPENARAIERFCIEHGVPFLGCVPFDKSASMAINEGKSIADVDCPARDALMKIYGKVNSLLWENDKSRPPQK